MTNIQIWGDSILKGVVYDESAKRYVNLTENGVALAQSAVTCTLTNLSRFGQTLPRARAKLEGALCRQPRPDAVIIELGGNDCDYNWKAVGDDPQGRHLPFTPPEIFTESLIELVANLRSLDITPILCTLPPIEHNRFFNWVTQGEVNAQGVLSWLGETVTTFRWQQSYDRRVRDVAQELKAPLIELRKPFMDMGDFSPLICVDGIHPNPEGQQIIGRWLAQGLNAVLQP